MHLTLQPESITLQFFTELQTCVMKAFLHNIAISLNIKKMILSWMLVYELWYHSNKSFLHLGGRMNSKHDLVKKTGVKRVSILFQLPYWEVSVFLILIFFNKTFHVLSPKLRIQKHRVSEIWLQCNQCRLGIAKQCCSRVLQVLLYWQWFGYTEYSRTPDMQWLLRKYHVCCVRNEL